MMAVQPGASFSLRIPETWFEFDVWRATRTGDLARMVDARLDDLPELRPHRKLILRGLRQLAEDAERRGAVYCAAAADRVDDDGMLLASLMVFNTVGMLEPALNTVEAIAAQLIAAGRSSSGSGATGSGATDAGSSDTGADGTGSSGTGSNGTGSNGTGANGTGSGATGAEATDAVAPWREVRVIELDAGRAVRVRGVTSLESPDGTQTLPIVSMQTLIPIPGSDDVLNVVLTSPLVSMAEGLLDLFDAISATLSWESGPAPG
jgi:hypothetical protein